MIFEVIAGLICQSDVELSFFYDLIVPVAWVYQFRICVRFLEVDIDVFKINTAVCECNCCIARDHGGADFVECIDNCTRI